LRDQPARSFALGVAEYPKLTAAVDDAPGAGRNGLDFDPMDGHCGAFPMLRFPGQWASGQSLVNQRSGASLNRI
jgi:hypothetical protein